MNPFSPVRAPGGRPLLACALVGVALAVTSIGMELTDAEPHLVMWVGVGAGALFLAALPLARGVGDDALTLRAGLLIGAGAGAVLAVIGLWRATGRDQPVVLLLLVPSLLLLITAALAVREARLAAHARRMKQLRARLQGQEDERRRWAQELHDQTLQDLAALELWLASLSRTHDPDRLAAGVEDARGMVHEQIGVLRHLITQMRPLALDTLGLRAAVQDLAHRAEGEVTVACDVERLPAGLPPDTQVAIYRIVQEALSNAVQHAHCHRIAVRATNDGSQLVVTVRDDGRGLPDPASGDAPSTSFGRIGMRERAESLGAHLTWSTPEGGGTMVTLRVPEAARPHS
ncbi:sensor histidine kinase [Kineosporia succinea]|uniref:Signal transduction histidine kinase n=1 Tax=Kineosporia succinea TaxID=84632 RepID=A0ABT9P995_9ACTN|nr:sensor histidine kinase [Kineosporia succinea]MDP9828989.1 signal transduction histidine kinase [Kineosporia succinea]